MLYSTKNTRYTKSTMLLARSFLFFFAALFLSFNTHSIAWADTFPSHIKEYSPQTLFPFINKQLPTILKLCLDDRLCGLLPEEQALISSIKQSLETENELNPELIHFESSVKNPSLFFVDGNTRIAVTGDHVGDSIYINLDLASQKDKYGVSHPLFIDRAIAILVHELGHHQGVKNHSSLDQLGLKIGNYFSTKLQWVAINGSEGQNQDQLTRPFQIFLAYVNFPFTSESKTGLQNLILIFDEEKIVDISSQIDDLTQCQAKTHQNTRLLNWDASSWRYGTTQDVYRCIAPGERTSYMGIDFYTLSATLQQSCDDTLSNFNISIDLSFHFSCPSQDYLNGKSELHYTFERVQSFKIIP